MSNDRVYIHEYIDIRGHNRANYMHHMTANWSPTAQEQRGQLCYGVWSLLGSTGPWPYVLNMWEEHGWDGLARSFEIEAVGSGAQDEKLAKWWATAASFRRGGFDRIMVPAPWTKTTAQVCAERITGATYAHEMVKVRPGAADDLMEAAQDAGSAALGSYGWELIGGFKTAMVNDDEALLLWSIPTWDAWAAGEKANLADEVVRAWRTGVGSYVIDWNRVLLVDSPLCPFKTHRQPSVEDRTDWEN